MIRVSDDRLGPEVNLCELKEGDTFIWNEYPCIRLDFGSNSAMVKGVKEDHVPCMLLASGQYIDIGRMAWVVPIKCKISITE